MKSIFMGATLRQAAPVDGGEAPVAAVVEGVAPPRSPLHMELPLGESLVGQWVKLSRQVGSSPELGKGGDTGNCGVIPL